MPVKISKQLERSNCSLLSADKRTLRRRGLASLARRRRRRPAVSWRGSRVKGHRQGERLEKQGSSEDWETESETRSSADVTEMEVSVEWRSVGLRDAERPRA